MTQGSHPTRSARPRHASWRTPPRHRRNRAGHDPAVAGRSFALGSGRSRDVPGQQGGRTRRRRLGSLQRSPSDADDLPVAFVDYEEHPREYTLSTVTTTIEVQTRIFGPLSKPDGPGSRAAGRSRRDGEGAAGKLTTSTMPRTAFCSSVAPSMRISTRAGAPTPDDLDELIAKISEGARVLSRASARDRRLRT